MPFYNSYSAFYITLCFYPCYSGKLGCIEGCYETVLISKTVVLNSPVHLIKHGHGKNITTVGIIALS